MELSRSQKKNQRKRDKKAAQKADESEPRDGQVQLPPQPTDVAPTALELHTQLVQFGLPLVATKLAEAGDEGDFDDTDCYMMLRSMDIISTILAQGLQKHRANRTAHNPDPDLFFTCDWHTSQQLLTATTQGQKAMQNVSVQTVGQQAVRTRGVTISVAPSETVQEGTSMVLPQPRPKCEQTSEHVYDEMWIAARNKAEQDLRRELQLPKQCELTHTQQNTLREKTIAMYRAKKKKCKAKAKKQ